MKYTQLFNTSDLVGKTIKKVKTDGYWENLCIIFTDNTFVVLESDFSIIEDLLTPEEDFSELKDFGLITEEEYKTYQAQYQKLKKERDLECAKNSLLLARNSVSSYEDRVRILEKELGII